MEFEDSTLVSLLQEILSKVNEGDKMWKTSEFDGSLRLFETVGLLLSQMTKFLDCLNGQVQCRKAEILIKLKRHFRALNEVQKALMIDGDNIDARRVRCEALVGLNQFDLAAEELRRLLLVDPANQRVKDQLNSTLKVRNLPSVPGCFECCPDLIWLRIFGYLDFRTRGRLELVSNGFRRLSLQSWTDVNSIPHAKMLGAEGEKLISPSYFEAILRRSGQFCTRVNLSCVDIAQVELSGTGRFRLRNKLRWLFSLIVANCPRISQISIPNAALIDEDLEFLFCNLKRLESISLHKVVGTPEGPLKGLSFRFCPPLTSLSINVSQICQCLTDEAIRLVADRCSATLNVFELHKHGGDYINDSSLEHLFISCAHLQKVSLQHFGEQLGTQLTGDSLMHIGTSLKLLTHLCLWLPVIKAEVVSGIVSGCRLLTTLEFHTGNFSTAALVSLASCQNLIDLRLDVPQNLPWRQLIPEIAGNNKNLEIFALTSVSEFDLSLTLELFGRLKQFCLWSTTDITAETLENLIINSTPKSSEVVNIVVSCYEFNISPTLREFLNRNSESTRLRLSCFIDHHQYHCDFAEI